ncbi:hypothetical protein EJD97_011733 [Solanum chilense]|uniref:Uncharacterized protein n=1 Tax=Solanum chilense TaxID=4083 RepID=A0A6N2CFD2_SOLCI|nr:hypothetical protein EJD97_011733 [Solanum chilense]
MNTRRAASRRVEKEMVNVGNQGNQVPPLEEVAMGDQVSDVPPPMIDGDIRADFLFLSQSMTSQDNAVTSPVQAMTAQMNREVEPRVPQHVKTMSSRLRDFTIINPPNFYG